MILHESCGILTFCTNYNYQHRLWLNVKNCSRAYVYGSSKVRFRPVWRRTFRRFGLRLEGLRSRRPGPQRWRSQSRAICLETLNVFSTQKKFSVFDKFKKILAKPTNLQVSSLVYKHLRLCLGFFRHSPGLGVEISTKSRSRRLSTVSTRSLITNID